MPVWRYVYEEKTLDLIIALISATLLSLVYIARPQERSIPSFPKQQLVIKPNL